MNKYAWLRELEFLKMHGLGNDFVVLDARADALELTADEVRAIADRRSGVGCDQLIIMTRSRAADAGMVIFNADGGAAEACGNAARCLAAHLMDESGARAATLETPAGIVVASRSGATGLISVDMGAPGLGWRDIPLAREADTLHLPLAAGPLADAVAVNVGNPHAVFLVDDAEAVDLDSLGPVLEKDALFPRRANISVASLARDDAIRLRVWERGTGITRACGTAACAALVAAHRRGLAGRRARIVLDGGELVVGWRADDHLFLTGPAATSFRGSIGELS